MLEDYKKAVIFDYHEKKEKGSLSSNLSHPSPAKLRAECINVLKSKFDEKDESFIKEFFNSNIESSDYSPSIKRFDTDRFRPLVRFMRGQIEDTADKNIELLAWLINFEPRPYRFGVDYPIPKVPEKDDTSKTDVNKGPQNSTPLRLPQPQSQSAAHLLLINWLSSLKKKKALPLLALIFLVTGGSYLYSNNLKSVYICDGGTSKRYHINPACPSLKNCKNNSVSTTVNEAKKNGKTLCNWETQ